MASAFFSLIRTLLSVVFIGLLSLQAKGDDRSLKLYLDADLSGGAAKAGQSIARGIEVALAEVNYQVNGVKLELVQKDHRGSSSRSHSHIIEFIEDQQGLLMYGGLHSPPLLANKDFINEQQVLTLIPWAAAGPITRSSSEENWIYRLSIDDSKAGAFIADHAIRKEGFKKPYLILEQTGWGRSNYTTMTRYLSDQGIAPVGVHWFNWNLGRHEAKIIARDLMGSGADVVFFVGNSPEGRMILSHLASASRGNSIAVRSHWGITGGSFYESLVPSVRKKMDLAFIQTRFSFLHQPYSPIAKKALDGAMKLFPEDIESAEDITAPTGFVHAYDLTRIMLSSLETLDTDLPVKELRSQLKLALESIEQPVYGLIQTYQKPFSTYSQQNKDAHEALSSEHFAMGRFDKSGVIKLEGVSTVQ